MLTATTPRLTDASNFALRAVALGLGFFALLRWSWIEAVVLLPLTRAQGVWASGMFGAPTLPVDVTLACSGADVLALCVGATCAYPVKWRMRLAGAGIGIGVIVALNILRIGSLGRLVTSPDWFTAFHLYVWPALLTLTVAAYVFGWMRLADRHAAVAELDARRHGSRNDGAAISRVLVSRRFVLLTVTFVVAFAVVVGVYSESSVILAIAGVIARAAAAVLSVLGVTAHSVGNVLWTVNGGFVVTHECVSTPLIPIYLSAVFHFSAAWRRRIFGIAAALPLFVGLGVARLLVVALPRVDSPLFFVHAFYQLLLAAVVVFLAALWRHGGRSALGRGLVGIAVGVTFVLLLGPLYTRMVAGTAIALPDAQGALAFLPAFQIGLYLALCVAAFAALDWARLAGGIGILAITQVIGLLVLQALVGSFGITMHVRDIRGWAVAAPVLVFAMVTSVARTRR